MHYGGSLEALREKSSHQIVIAPDAHTNPKCRVLLPIPHHSGTHVVLDHMGYWVGGRGSLKHHMTRGCKMDHLNTGELGGQNLVGKDGAERKQSI